MSVISGRTFAARATRPTVPPSSNDFDFGNFDDGWSLGGGIGYQITRYLRTDLTADWLFESDFTGQTSDGIKRFGGHLGL